MQVYMPPLEPDERQMVSIVNQLERTEHDIGRPTYFNLNLTDTATRVANLELERRGLTSRVVRHSEPEGRAPRD